MSSASPFAFFRPGMPHACTSPVQGRRFLPFLRRCSGAAAATALATLLVACGGGQGGADSTAESADAEGRAVTLGVSSSAQSSGKSGSASQSVKSSPTANPQVALTTIALRTKTTIADNVGAFVKLRYNGRIIASAELRNTEMMDVVFRVDVAINGGTLDVIFSNATYANGVEARQLTVSGVIVNGTPFAWFSPGVVYDTGHYAEAYDGLNVLPATDYLTMTGALRFPMTGADGLGPMQLMDASLASAPPGIYVDAWGGSDTYTGGRDRPVRSLARVQQVPLLPGENIYLRCGGVWRESLELSNNNLSDGTSVLPYGDCAGEPKPVITGGNSFNGGWTKNGSVWSRAVPAGTPKISRLLVGFTAMRTAQWPNAGAPAVAAQGSTGLSVNLQPDQAAELAGRDLSNASIMLRTHPWKVEPRQLNANGLVGQAVGLTQATEYVIQGGTTYVLRDKAWMLDAPGEFFHDVAANRLYLIAAPGDAAADLNALTVEGSVRDLALYMRDRRFLKVQGVALRMTRGDGLRMTNTPDAVVSDIEATDHAAAGVRFQQWAAMPNGAVGPTLQKSFISGNGEFGVDARYVDFARITGNRVMDIGMADYTGNVDSGVASGPGARVENNVFSNIGFSAVRFSALRASVIADNEISEYCRRLSDCGAIYTWTGTPNHPQAGGSVVERNRIHPGQPVTYGSVPWGHNGLFGIYIDDFSNGVTVRNNFVRSVPNAIFVHNAGSVTVENNKIWMPTHTGISIDMDATNFDFATNINVRYNEVVPYTSTSGAWPNVPTFNSTHAFSLVNFFSGEGAFGPGRVHFHDNRVVQLHGENAEHARIQTLVGSRAVTAAEWRQINPGEPPIEQPIGYSSYWVALGPESVQGGEFTTGLGHWSVNYNWQVPGFDVQPAPNQPGCNGPCVRMTSASSGDMIFSPGFALDVGKLYMYRRTAVSSGPAAEIGWPYISRTTWPWDEMQDWRGFQGRSSRALKAGGTLNWEAFFRPKGNGEARVNLTLGTLNVPVYYDAISVREVTMWLASGPSEWVAPVVAARDTARSVNGCGDIGLPANCTVADLSGAPVNFPFTVAANQQRLLLWSNSPYRK